MLTAKSAILFNKYIIDLNMKIDVTFPEIIKKKNQKIDERFIEINKNRLTRFETYKKAVIF